MGFPPPSFFGISNSDSDSDDFPYEDSDLYYDYEDFDDYTNPFHEDYMDNNMDFISLLKDELKHTVQDNQKPSSQVAVPQDLDSLVKSGGDKTHKALLKLPLGIFLDIISRLPVKPLAVARCVCKTWRTIIHHPRFIKMHHTKATQQPPNAFNCQTGLLLHLGLNLMFEFKQFYPADRNFSEIHFLERDNNDSFDNACVVTPQLTPSKFPFKPSDLKYDIVGSCNGLLCMGDALYADPIYVCNPVVGEYVALPKYEKRADFGIVSGFGFDQVAGEYKVIRMVFSVNYKGENRMEAEVYTLGSGSKWRKLGDVPIPFCEKSMPVFVNGTLHWITEQCQVRYPLLTKRCFDWNLENLIVAFDVGREEFRVVQPPPDFKPFCEEECKLHLGDLGGNLCLLDYSPGQCNIWAMKNYGVNGSWTKQYVISRTLTELGFRSDDVDLKPVTLMNNGNILLAVNHEALVCYDPVRKGFSKLEIPKILPRFEAITHVGSFISLKDIVGPASSDHSINSSRWYGDLCPVSSQIEIDDLMLTKQLNDQLKRLWWESH